MSSATRAECFATSRPHVAKRCNHQKSLHLHVFYLTNNLSGLDCAGLPIDTVCSLSPMRGSQPLIDGPKPADASRRPADVTGLSLRLTNQHVEMACDQLFKYHKKRMKGCRSVARYGARQMRTWHAGPTSESTFKMSFGSNTARKHSL